MKRLKHLPALLLIPVILCTGCQKATDSSASTVNEASNATMEELSSATDTTVSTQESTEADLTEASTEDTTSEDTVTKFEAFKIGDTEEKDGWMQTTVYPNNIDDTFVIDVLLPDDYDESVSYPVVYLTDCYWRRENYPEIKDLYTSGKTEEFILVGIGYPDTYDFDTIRERDLLFHPDAFLDMIINGVLPYAENNYSIDSSNRTFCGASHGGYFMCYSILQSNDLTKDIFKNYILASPSLYEMNNVLYLPTEEKEFIENTNDLPLNIYITVGGCESVPYAVRPTEMFAKKLENKNYPNLHITYKVYDGLDHYEVWVPTLLDGLSDFLKK